MTRPGPYSEYRESNASLGRLPSHWPEPHLTHVAAAPITNGLGEAAADGDADWPRYIRTTDISGLFELDAKKRVTLAPDVAQSAMLRQNDLLMTAAGSLGTSHLYAGGEPACYAGYLVRFRADERRVLAQYAAWWTRSRHHLDQVALGAVRSTIDNFSAGKFRSMLIPVPPLPEQRAIADYLDRETAQIDALIGKQERLIETLQERRAAVVGRAVTKGLDLVEMRGSNLQWAGDMPAHWSVKRVSWLFGATGSGTTPAPEDIVDPTDETIAWATTGELRERVIKSTKKSVLPETVRSLSALRVYPPGTLLMAMYGATIGRMAVLGIPAVTNQACCAMSAPANTHVRFVEYALQVAKPHLILMASGGGQPNINQDKVRSLRLPTPPLVEQRHIAGYLDEQTAKIDALIAKTERFIEVSKERRSALITAAVTGQIDVRERVGSAGAQSTVTSPAEQKVQPA